MDDLQQAVAKLRTLSPRLNAAIEQAQRVVHQIEHFLAHECHVAVQAEVPVTYNEKGVAVALLRYGRVDGRFRICLTSTDGDSRFLSRSWAECDRSEKLASFPALPKLLMAITKAVETQINATNTTATTVNALMTALGATRTDEQPPSERNGQPKLTFSIRPEEALVEQVSARPLPRPRPAPKSNPDHDARRPAPKKEEAKVG